MLIEYNLIEKIAYRYVTGLQVDEPGYIGMKALKSIQRPFGLTIERDIYFVQKPLNECLSEEKWQMWESAINELCHYTFCLYGNTKLNVAPPSGLFSVHIFPL